MRAFAPAVGDKGADGINGTNGTNGANGTNGLPGVNAFGYPNARTVALATAYQCSDPTKPGIFTITLTSTASLSLGGGTTNTADVLVGNSSTIATTGGSAVGKYSNTITGTLVVGLGINTVANTTYTVFVPAGGYVAVRQTGGTVSVVSAFDQSVG